MSEKRLETVGGSFRSWKRSELEQGDRAVLRDYFEARGSAVYASESMELLRAAALEDFDGERSC